MQAIITKYLGPTNTRGSRIKVTSWQGSKTYSYDYAAPDPHVAAFEEWLEETNEQMQRFHGTECSGDDWFKLTTKGASPDGKGYVFIIQ